MTDDDAIDAILEAPCPTPSEAEANAARLRARDERTLANIGLVVTIARRFARRGVDLEDLVQAGTVGLMKASSAFDPSRGEFRHYAPRWIEGAMRDALAGRDTAASWGDAAGDLVDPGAEGVVEGVHRAELRERVRAALRFLAPNHRRVVELRYGLEDGRERSMIEVGGLVGLTRSRVHQIEAKALARLRAVLG